MLSVLKYLEGNIIKPPASYLLSVQLAQVVRFKSRFVCALLMSIRTIIKKDQKL